ncbi:MAG: response regulator, partial [Actinomycetota bacterium]|nr:response regulator [Actinomycetota bacterium]
MRDAFTLRAARGRRPPGAAHDRALLQAEGWSVREAASVAEAERALAEPPQVVVLDDQLPDGSGAELAARVGALAPDAAVVLHTG